MTPAIVVAEKNSKNVVVCKIADRLFFKQADEPLFEAK
jgi:hypothetical protein